MRTLTDLGAARERFDLVFVDAPYANDLSAAVLAATPSKWNWWVRADGSWCDRLDAQQRWRPRDWNV